MKYTTIPKTDLNVSTIALGTWVFGGNMWGGADKKDCLAAVGQAIDLGINFIDTAPIYSDGISESIIGEAIKGKRDQLILATKCGPVRNGGKIGINLSPESILKEIDDSLKRLRVDYIDIYQCHWPDPNTPIEKTMETLLKIQEQQKIKYIGVSNFGFDLISQASQTAEIVTLQSQYSLLERNIQEKDIPFCLENNIGILPYGPMGGGILTGKYASEPNFKKSDARSFFYKYYKGTGYKKAMELIEEMKSLNRPVNEIAINWVRQQPGVSSVLVGARNADQVSMNAKAAEWDLSEDEMKLLTNCKAEMT